MRARCGTGEGLTEAGMRNREPPSKLGGNLVKDNQERLALMGTLNSHFVHSSFPTNKSALNAYAYLCKWLPG